MLALLRSHDDDVVGPVTRRATSVPVAGIRGWNHARIARDHVFYFDKGDWPYKPRETVTRMSEHSLGSAAGERRRRRAPRRHGCG